MECEKLKLNINKVEAEIEDLTTSLFEEANKMVYEANLKHNKAEKKLAVAEGKVSDILIYWQVNGNQISVQPMAK